MAEPVLNPIDLLRLAKDQDAVAKRMRQLVLDDPDPDDRVDVLINETAGRLEEMSRSLVAVGAYLNKRPA